MANSAPNPARYDSFAAMRASPGWSRPAPSRALRTRWKCRRRTLTKLIQTLGPICGPGSQSHHAAGDGHARRRRLLRARVQLLADLEELDGSMALSQTSRRGGFASMSAPRSPIFLIIRPWWISTAAIRHPDRYRRDRSAGRSHCRECDCVIRGGEISDQSLIARRIGEMSFITCASPAYLERYGEPQTRPISTAITMSSAIFSAESGRRWPFTFVSGDDSVEVPGAISRPSTTALPMSRRRSPALASFRRRSSWCEKHLDDGSLRRILSDWTTEPMRCMSSIRRTGT